MGLRSEAHLIVKKLAITLSCALLQSGPCAQVGSEGSPSIGQRDLLHHTVGLVPLAQNTRSHQRVRISELIDVTIDLLTLSFRVSFC